jgi:hypothetical protein
MNWFKDKISKYFPKKLETNNNSRNPFEDMYQDLGIFQYDNDGFSIDFDDISLKLKWSDITQLNAYKKDLLTIDRIELEIIYGDKSSTISEDLPGWYQFVEKTKEIYPTISKDWDSKIIHPPFATNFMIIYNKF